MKAVITGGAGFIGSHIADALLAAGVVVHVVDDFSTGRLENLECALQRGTHLHTADVTDEAAMSELLAAVRPELVYHLAAQIDVRRSMAEPAWDARVNVTGTVSMLEAAVRSGARRFLLASTAAVYGDPAVIPTSESQPVAPVSAYGAARPRPSPISPSMPAATVSTLALRMANVYGPRQDPGGEAGVITIFSADRRGRPSRHRLRRRAPDARLRVRGRRGRAFLAAARSPATGALNIGTGRETPVLAIAQALGATVQFAPGRPGEIERSCLDPRAARRALGWRAATALRDALASQPGAIAA